MVGQCVLLVVCREEWYQSVGRVVDDSPHLGVIVPSSAPRDIVLFAKIVEWIDKLVRQTFEICFYWFWVHFPAE